jgi:hypothetical protein
MVGQCPAQRGNYRKYVSLLLKIKENQSVNAQFANKKKRRNNKYMSDINIHELKLAGFKVDVFHYRLPKVNNLSNRQARKVQPMLSHAFDNKDEISARGGLTKVMLDKAGVKVESEAVCSIKDPYNRKIGLKKALARAKAKWTKTFVEKSIANGRKLEDVLNELEFKKVFIYKV